MKFWNLEPSQLADGTKVLDISLFGEIDPGFFGDGIASKEIAAQLTAHADAKRINVRINSVGGDLFGGMSIYNLLRGHGAEVTTIVDGVAASAASIVAMAGRTVMNRGSMMMIHNPMLGTMGDAEDHRHAADVLDKARDSLVNVYQKKTGMKPAALKKLLDAETWLTADEAKRQGFADEVADKETKARATADGVLINSIAFRRDTLPKQIWAMAMDPTDAEHEPEEPGHDPDPAPAADEPAADPAPAPIEAPAEPAPAPPPAEDPAAAQAKAYASGVAAERSRIAAILDLGLSDIDPIVRDAMIGDKPMDAPALAVAAIKATGKRGLSILEARRAESKEAAGVRQTAPEKNKVDLENEAAKTIAGHANRRRGGVR